jgi:predicted flap endonuclease-1-like 5' DNA nuclease/uncharacterized membrane protein YeaQ/YmgE (transglycosylase-associated protein family)
MNMTQSDSGMECRKICWAIAIVIGCVAALLLGTSADWHWLLAILAGVIVAVLGGWILNYFFCGQADEAATRTAAATAAATAGAAAASTATKVEETAAPVAEAVEDTTTAAVETVEETVEEVAEAADDTLSGGDGDAAVAGAAAADVISGPDGKPTPLDGPRGGQADDLKKIEGIGPKLEELCNSLGIYHYDQIAAWGEAEVAWMDGNMPRFKGRVTRDKWVAQAKLILEVGMEEFLERAKTNDY